MLAGQTYVHGMISEMLNIFGGVGRVEGGVGEAGGWRQGGAFRGNNLAVSVRRTLNHACLYPQVLVPPVSLVNMFDQGPAPTE